MNLTKRLILVLAAAVAAGIARADVPETADAPVGLLGQRYGAVSFGDRSINGISNQAYMAGYDLNYPLLNHLDIDGKYAYSLLNSAANGLWSHHASFLATGYFAWENVKPFAGVGFGEQWDESRTAGIISHAYYTTWEMSVGAEFALKYVSLTPYFDYNSDSRIKAQSVDLDNIGARVNYWFLKNWAVSADAGYQNALHSTADAWYWIISVRERF